MTDIDRAIAKRVRRVRFANQITQAAFAKAINESIDRIASIEYERTPLTVGLADEICITFDVNLAWLASGKGNMKPFIGRIEDISYEIDASELLSKTFNDDIQKRLLEKYYADFDYNLFGGDAIHTGFGALPEGEAAEKYLLRFVQDLNCSFAELPHAGKEKMLSLMVRIFAKFSKEWQYGRRDFPGWPDEDTENDLTEAETSEKMLPVKVSLQNLLERLHLATKETGKMSELADFLGKATGNKVPLASVSRWLSGKREPGGQITLALLDWVEQQERKTKKP